MPTVKLTIFDRVSPVESEADLITKLQTCRQGKFGGFWISHTDCGAHLGVHVNGEFAFVTFLHGHDHPGFLPLGMTPEGCPVTLRFLPEDVEIDAEFICSVDTAYRAAAEFYRKPELPTCISWHEL